MRTRTVSFTGTSSRGAKYGTPYVLDFGIAREIQETMTHVTGKLSSGTLPYMSPEQLNGSAAKPAQDVYSFAAMVYECLTGRPPFSRGQIEFQIEHEKPEPLPPEVGIRGSVMAGLAKTAALRPATCVGVLKCGAGPSVSHPKTRPTPHRFTFHRVEQPWYARIRIRSGFLPWLVVAVSVALVAVVFGVRSHRKSVRLRVREAAAQAERSRIEAEEREESLREEKTRQAELRRRAERQLAQIVKKEAAAAEREKTKQHILDLAETAGHCLERSRALGLEDGLEHFGEACGKGLAEVRNRVSNDVAAAMVLCSNVLVRCRKLEELCGQRDSAKSSREAMELARTKAGGSRDRTDMRVADAARTNGQMAFADLRFDVAAAEFDKAAEAYGRAAAAEARARVEAGRRAEVRERIEAAARQERERALEEYRRRNYSAPNEESPLSHIKPRTYWQDEPEVPKAKRSKRGYRLKPSL